MISSGHRYTDILEYTWSQYLLFVEAAAVKEKRAWRDQYVAMLLASNPTKESVRKVLGDVDR